MFDFEKLDVYNETRNLNRQIFSEIIHTEDTDPYIKDQLKRASLSILLNLSEGTGRMSKPDKKRFYVMARGSLNEVVALLHVMQDLNNISEKLYVELYDKSEKISKMLLGMIRSMTQ